MSTNGFVCSEKCEVLFLRSLQLRFLEQLDLTDILALGCNRNVSVSFSFLERVVFFSKIDLAICFKG